MLPMAACANERGVLACNHSWPVDLSKLEVACNYFLYFCNMFADRTA